MPALHNPLRRRLAAAGHNLDEGQIGQLGRYCALLLHWNRRINLTGIVDEDRVITHHLLDSLSVLPCLRGSRILDLGTGARAAGRAAGDCRQEFGLHAAGRT